MPAASKMKRWNCAYSWSLIASCVMVGLTGGRQRSRLEDVHVPAHCRGGGDTQNLAKWVSSISATGATCATTGLLREAERFADLRDAAATTFAASELLKSRISESSLKNAMVCCNCSAWLLISSEVAASSSELEAFCCVVWLSWPTAELIWPTPEDCSSEAAVISCTRSEVFLMFGTIWSSSWPARSASSTLEVATVPIS